MKLISMQLNNFKSFHGLSEVFEFGISGDKNITVITGGNGTGKTNVIESIMWLLYEDSFTHSSANQPFINVKALDEAKTGEELSFWVSLSFNYQGKVYQAKRIQRLEKTGVTEYDNKGSAGLELYRQDGYQSWNHVKDAQLTIDKYFPLELYRYFIIDGEKLEELLTYDSRVQLLNTIVNFSGNSNCNLADITGVINEKVNKIISDIGIGSLFQFDIANRSNSNWANELSVGHRIIISLSIIRAVIECFKSFNVSSLTGAGADIESLEFSNRPSDVLGYPIIVDSIFSCIDEGMAFNFVPFLSEFASQVIIIENNSQIERLPQVELDKKIANYYFLG